SPDRDSGAAGEPVAPADPVADPHGGLTELVLAQVAGVLGYPDPGEVDRRRTFTDLGFDSLMTVGLLYPPPPRPPLPLPSRLPPPPLRGCAPRPPHGPRGGGGRPPRARRDRCPRRTTRSPSSAWPAGTPAACPPRMSCGSWPRPAGTRSAASRPTVAGTWRP